MKALLLLLLLLNITIASAQYQKLDAPVNDDGRSLSFHLYHFDARKNPAQLHSNPKHIESAVHPRSHLAGVALGKPSPNQTFTLSSQQGILKVTAGNKAGSSVGPCLFSKTGNSLLKVQSTIKAVVGEILSNHIGKIQLQTSQPVGEVDQADHF